MTAKKPLRFSANLGFLWADRPLPDAIRAAKSAGFHAVECHWPYATDPAMTRAALEETGLAMLGLNTIRGDIAAGENGLCALPHRKHDARAAIAEAAEYAKSIGAKNIHVMAGRADPDDAAARTVFMENLAQAHDLCAPAGIGILIEMLNPHDAPGYFLASTEQAREIITAMNLPRLKFMFDCYHVGRSEAGNADEVIARFHALLPIIGHIQFASTPDRGAPDHGDLDYAAIFAAIGAAGWDMPLGAEYKPPADTPTDDTLGWLGAF